MSKSKCKISATRYYPFMLLRPHFLFKEHFVREFKVRGKKCSVYYVTVHNKTRAKIRCINRRKHSIKHNKIQIVKHSSWQISNSYIFGFRSAILRESTETRDLGFGVPSSGNLLRQEVTNPTRVLHLWSGWFSWHNVYSFYVAWVTKSSKIGKEDN